MAKAFILAGEPSGDKLAAALMRASHSRFTSWVGIGGPLMQAEGLNSHPDFEQLQIIGFMQALMRYNSLKQLMNELVEAACNERPEVIFTVDSKAFSIRFAKKMRAKMQEQGWQAPIIHMVAPTVWAYGKGRARAFEAAFDGLLCLFPMEPAYFKAERCPAIFIGHPAAYDMPEAFGKKDADKMILCVLPGSRRSEINAHLPDFLYAIKKIDHVRDFDVVIPTLPELEKQVARKCRLTGIKARIVTGRDAFQKTVQEAHIMVAASGTATLETALAGIPGVVAYRLNSFVAAIMKMRFQLKDPVLPNIILNDDVYPFLFQQQLSPTSVSTMLGAILVNYPHNQGQLVLKSRALRDALTTSHDDFEDAIKAALQQLLILP